MNDKPIILVSKCLGFSNCRYNGQGTNDDFIKLLQDYVEYITVCPDVEIGLGIPRETIRLVEVEGEVKVLKSRSPSCGVKDVKVYSSTSKGSSFKKGVGSFAKEVLDEYKDYPIEDNGRLKDFKLREVFLTRLFVAFELKNILEDYSYDKLLKFHNKHTLIFSMYNKSRFQIMDILCHKLKESIEDKGELVEEYLKNVFITTN